MSDKIAILGMGRSGRSAAKLALSKGMEVNCIDSNPKTTPIDNCTLHLDSEFDVSSVDLLVVSPGVPSTHPLVQKAIAMNISVLGELAFASQFIESPLLAITGTNGKSSTAWYADQLLSQTTHKPFLGGNFGTALSEMALHPDEYTVGIIEVSSYQMEFPGTFHPKAACILNLTPDHLARHKTMDLYREIKLRIFSQQNQNDLAILPIDSPNLTPSQPVQKLYFNAHPGVTIEGGQLSFQLPEGTFNISTETLSIFGTHNLENIAAASLLCSAIGIDLKRLDYSKITALEHRLELCPTTDGLFWINDSKATNIEATQAALKALSAPLIILLGGAGKEGADYTLLHPLLKEKAQAVFCFGASGSEIQTQLQTCQYYYQLEKADTLQDAMQKARSAASSTSKILLSPACASFDQFDNFEHRGRVFAQALNQGELS